jgi:Rad3-related DNA helicase
MDLALPLTKIPSPRELGLPEKFTSWRDEQVDMILRGINTPKRFIATAAPTGIGKSLYYIAKALITGRRTVIVTGTRGLQKQLMADFEASGLAAIMGKRNYTCEGGSDDWTCEQGHRGNCGLVGTPSCDYQSAYFRALQSKLIITNYAFWIAVNKYGLGLGDFEELVLDEAHTAPAAIADAMQLTFSNHEADELLHVKFPTIADSLSEWQFWGRRIVPLCRELIQAQEAKVRSTNSPKTSWLDKLHHLVNLERKLSTLSLIRPQDWVVEATEKGYQLDPIRIAPYAERTLFRKIPHIDFVSATIRPKTLMMCGIKWDDFEFNEYRSPFPVENCPVYWIPTVPVSRGLSEDGYVEWVRRHDQIIKARSDRKGLIHAVSYENLKRLVNGSRHVRQMVFNNRGEDMDQVVKMFKKMPQGIVLASPSVATGYDFPEESKGYQIISKVPFPNQGSPVVQARQAIDPEYGAYHAMQLIVQASGRMRRTPQQKCEVFVVDDQMKWFYGRYCHLAPQSFQDQYQGETVLIPKPL